MVGVKTNLLQALWNLHGDFSWITSWGIISAKSKNNIGSERRHIEVKYLHFFIGSVDVELSPSHNFTSNSNAPWIERINHWNC